MTDEKKLTFQDFFVSEEKNTLIKKLSGLLKINVETLNDMILSEKELEYHHLFKIESSLSRQELFWVRCLFPFLGASSRTIKNHMQNKKEDIHHEKSFPWDCDDFQRCYYLLTRHPEWRTRLNEMSQYGIIWKNIVTFWDQMEIWYESKNYKTVTQILSTLIDQGREEHMNVHKNCFIVPLKIKITPKLF